MIAISAATVDDIKTIQDIVYITWPVTYGKILSKEQLDFMLDKMYSNESLTNEFLIKKQQFLLAKENEVCLGFTSFEHHYLGKKKTHIHKIYLLPNAQGKGIGRILIAEIEKLAVENQDVALSLNVNRFNKAKYFYEKIGFQIKEEVDIEIGNGYLMEDYIMEKKV